MFTIFQDSSSSMSAWRPLPRRSATQEARSSTWRGARPEKLLGFEEAWDAKKIIMSRNYRCGQEVIDIANRVLHAMAPETRLDTEMVCELGTHSDIGCHVYTDLDDEGEALRSESGS